MELTKREILQGLSIGERVAEFEHDLSSYFVETEQWRQVFRGEKDVVYGAKGSGKSAIYTSLLKQKVRLSNERKIMIIPAENLQGAPVFEEFSDRLPTDDKKFQFLWKIYFLLLIGGRLFERAELYGRQGKAMQQLLGELERTNLLSNETLLGELLRKTVDVISRVESIEAGVEVDPTTSSWSFAFPRIKFGKKQKADIRTTWEKTSPDEIFTLADKALGESGLTVWIAVDRLDVAFDHSEELENTALKALFRVYRNLLTLKNISLKLFLRDDIWERITKRGFREASSITRDTRILWDKEELFNLIIRRLVHNDSLCKLYDVDRSSFLKEREEQRSFFYKIFPRTVQDAQIPVETFKWMMLSTQDGTGKSSPRELIHLISAARQTQINRLNLGFKEPPGGTLFDPESLKSALTEVSFERLSKYLYAEFPSIRADIQSLERMKAKQTPAMLSESWGVPMDEALARAKNLVEIGVFQRQGPTSSPVFLVPVLYSTALNMDRELAKPSDSSPAGSSHDSEGHSADTDSSDVVDIDQPSEEEAFNRISQGFDDPREETRDDAARALFRLSKRRVDYLNRAIEEGGDERRRHIGSAIVSSGLAKEMIERLLSENREVVYEALSVLFVMAKLGEINLLRDMSQNHPNVEVRRATTKLLVLAGRGDMVPKA